MAPGTWPLVKEEEPLTSITATLPSAMAFLRSSMEMSGYSAAMMEVAAKRERASASNFFMCLIGMWFGLFAFGLFECVTAFEGALRGRCSGEGAKGCQEGSERTADIGL